MHQDVSNNEFDKIDSTPTLPPIEIKAISKTALAEEFADALRRGYLEADLRKRAMDLISEIISLAKTFI